MTPFLVGFPRIRGDVPPHTPHIPKRHMFSPHTRGCSWNTVPPEYAGEVFPAYAGMFLPHSLGCDDASRFPRIRGDVPGSAVGENVGF